MKIADDIYIFLGKHKNANLKASVKEDYQLKLYLNP
jgi:hypothetical protein